MPKITWNEAGERLYETGVSRGVLYLPSGTAVPWNGLTSIEEEGSEETQSFYFDGIKYFDLPAIEDYAATLSALTYPDEFLPFDGFVELGHGLVADDQPLKRFNLSYQTRIGSDLDDRHGYKIHLVYNLTAVPSEKSFQTLTNSVEGMEFNWEIAGVPERITGYRPTAHAIIDSTRMNPYLLKDLENILYGFDDVVDGGTAFSNSPFVPMSELDGGTASSTSSDIFDVENTEFSDGRLPPLQELLDLLSAWSLIEITNHGDGTWSATGPDEIVRLITPTRYQIDYANVRYLDADTYIISDTKA